MTSATAAQYSSVPLSCGEWVRALGEGVRRWNCGLRQAPRNGAPMHPLVRMRLDLIGAVGEMAVASFYGAEDVFLSSKPDRGVDIPSLNIDAKTRSKHYYRGSPADLLVQLDDAPGKVYAHVTVVGLDVRYWGWIDSAGAMRDEHRADKAGGRPAFFVPVSALCPPSEPLPSTVAP